MEYSDLVAALRNLPPRGEREASAERAYEAMLYDFPQVHPADAAALLQKLQECTEWPAQFALSRRFVRGLGQILSASSPDPSFLALPSIIIRTLLAACRSLPDESPLETLLSHWEDGSALEHREEAAVAFRDEPKAHKIPEETSAAEEDPDDFVFEDYHQAPAEQVATSSAQVQQKVQQPPLHERVRSFVEQIQYSWLERGWDAVGMTRLWREFAQLAERQPLLAPLAPQAELLLRMRLVKARPLRVETFAAWTAVLRSLLAREKDVAPELAEEAVRALEQALEAGLSEELPVRSGLWDALLDRLLVPLDPSSWASLAGCAALAPALRPALQRALPSPPPGELLMWMVLTGRLDDETGARRAGQEAAQALFEGGLEEVLASGPRLSRLLATLEPLARVRGWPARAAFFSSFSVLHEALLRAARARPASSAPTAGEARDDGSAASKSEEQRRKQLQRLQQRLIDCLKPVFFADAAHKAD
jgi:hypothetical protein